MLSSSQFNAYFKIKSKFLVELNNKILIHNFKKNRAQNLIIKMAY